MGKYTDILDEREKKTGSISINPLVNILNLGKAVSEDERVGTGADIVRSTFSRYTPDWIKQGGEVLGSGFMSVIKNIDRPRGTLAGVWDVLGETGPKFQLNTDTGGYEWVDQDSVTEDESLASQLKEGAIEGWKDPFSKSFADEVTSLYPEAVKEFSPGGVPVGKTLEFLTDVGLNIGGDPLTTLPTRAISAPFQAAKYASDKTGLTGVGQKILDFGPIKNALEKFNV